MYNILDEKLDAAYAQRYGRAPKMGDTMSFGTCTFARYTGDEWLLIDDGKPVTVEEGVAAADRLQELVAQEDGPDDGPWVTEILYNLRRAVRALQGTKTSG